MLMDINKFLQRCSSPQVLVKLLIPSYDGMSNFFPLSPFFEFFSVEYTIPQIIFNSLHLRQISRSSILHIIQKVAFLSDQELALEIDFEQMFHSDSKLKVLIPLKEA